VPSTALTSVGAGGEAGEAGEEGKRYCVALGDVVGEEEGRSCAKHGVALRGRER